MSPDFDILVIDDEPVVLAAAKKILEPEGFSMDEASSADVGMAKLEGFTYRLVLCDLKLPEGKGWDLIDYDYLEQVVQLNLAVFCNMVGGPPPPQPPIIAPMAQAGSYVLNWLFAPQAAGYAISFRPVGSETYPPFRFVGASQAGDVVLTGFDPDITYGVSLAALGENGRLGNFSPEVIIGPLEADVDS